MVLVTTTACMDFKISPKKEKLAFEKAIFKPAHNYLNINGQAFHYVSVGDKKLPALLILHGSPGGLGDYVKYLADSQLTKVFYLVAVDRPGFGESGYGVGLPNLDEQVKIIHHFSDHLEPGQLPITVMGHSYGGPLALRYAMLYPNEIKRLILLAAAIDPALEEKEWFRPLFKTRFFHLMLPGAINASNAELITLKADLEKAMPDWKNITMPVEMVHGTKDMLVPYANTAFARKMLPDTAQLHILTLTKVNHFIPWTHYDTIKAVILKPFSGGKSKF